MSREPTNDGVVERVLDYFAAKQPEEARLARTLLERGGCVAEAWGPKQMAVWHLEIERGNWIVFLHSERGFGDWAQIVPSPRPASPWDGSRPMGLAIFAWARGTGVELRIESPEDLQRDLATHACDALDWLEAGNEHVLDRVFQAWIERFDRPEDEVLAAMEAAV